MGDTYDTYDCVDGPDKIKTTVLRDRILHTKSCDKIPAELITQLLIAADKNKDGYIDKYEFEELVRIKE